MKDISIGIYHKDHQYGKRLMEYLNHQKDFPMTASFTSDEEMFFKQEQEGDFECLVLAEETDYHGDFPVCRIGANESMGGMYCQSAKEIAAGIYHCLNVSPQIENERILGVYSPIPRLEISAFARNMANAIEAAANADGDKYIFIKISAYHKMTVVHIENSCGKVKWKKRMPVSDKGKGRGIGLLNVKQSIDKYDGDLQLKQDGNRFVADLFLNS